jgi:hypothetical protein
MNQPPPPNIVIVVFYLKILTKYNIRTINISVNCQILIPIIVIYGFKKTNQV